VTGFGSFDNSTCKRVLDLLEPGDLRLAQVVIKRVAVVKLGVNNGSGDGGSCFGIKVWTEVSSRVSGGERGVVDFGKLFTETNEQKFSLGGVQCKKIRSHPGRNLI